MYLINQSNKTPLHLQLYAQIKKDIIDNYKVGDKLPSLRKLASVYNLSRTTVESAYAQLVVEGYIESYPKKGYIVEDINASVFKSNIKIEEVQDKKESFLYDFNPVALCKNNFPIKIWKRLFNKYIDESLDFGSYHNGQGEEGLRVQIAKYINKSRGVNCSANQIVIGCGFTHSMEVLAKLLDDRYTTLSIENPGYNMAKNAFLSHGYDIKKVSIDKHGIKVDELEKQNSRLVYVTPSHQYPTGVTMPVSNRYKLLAWADKNDGFIIEDDCDSELSYVNRPVPSLQGLDKSNRVIYIGTFSKSLSASFLRVSYMVLPKPLLEIYKNHYTRVFSTVPLMLQITLEKFISEGHWDKHLRKIRTINRKKHNLMKSLLEEKLGESVKIEAQGAGLAILINPNVAMNLSKLKTLAKKQRIKLYFAKDVCGGDWDAIRMGFAVFKEEELEPALEMFSRIWHEARE